MASDPLTYGVTAAGRAMAEVLRAKELRQPPPAIAAHDASDPYVPLPDACARAAVAVLALTSHSSEPVVDAAREAVADVPDEVFRDFLTAALPDAGSPPSPEDALAAVRAAVAAADALSEVVTDARSPRETIRTIRATLATAAHQAAEGPGRSKLLSVQATATPRAR